MKLAILKIILWSAKPGLAPRIILFKEDQINVLTGQSGSGKSSLTWIIDYCLGSSSCSIPVGVIRDNVSWFGLHLQLAKSQMLIARLNPGAQKENDNYYIHEAQVVEVIDTPFKNSRRDDLVNRLNELAQLPQLDFNTTEAKEGYKARPSVRDLVAFCFLPQHIVANQYTLLYRTDTTVHRERLRNILPLALGAIDATTLELQHELIDLQRQYDKKQRQLTAAKNAVNAWFANLKGYYAKAQELGLASPDQVTVDWTTDDYLTSLRRLAQNTSDLAIPQLPAGAIERAAQELAQLASQEEYLSRELARLRRRTAQILRVKGNAHEYQGQLASQQDRLQGVSWFEEHIKAQGACPFCHSTSEAATEQVASLLQLSQEVQQISSALTRTPPVVDKQLAELRRSAIEFEERLNELRRQKGALEGSQKEREAYRYTQAETYRFLGRLEQALESATYVTPDSELAQSLAELSEKIEKIRETLDPQLVKRRSDTALNKIATKISLYAEQLQLERCRDHIRLDPKELTLQFQADSRRDYLFEIGSGQNWMGYHISALCALQEYFTESPKNPVPQFLMIDQPSQVYFPEAWPTADGDPRKNAPLEEQPELSADIEGVRRIFATLSNFLKQTKHRVQVIVTEHAGEITWHGIEGVHVVGNWRKGADEFLIPKEWQTP